MTETGISGAEKRSLPTRWFQGLRGLVRGVLGQVATKEFWLDLIKFVVRDMAVAFVQAVGGRMLWYGEKNADPEVKSARVPPKPPPSSTAFSSGYSPQPEYRNYPVATDFPGFGSR